MATTTEAFSGFIDSATVLDLMELAKFTNVTPGTVLKWMEKKGDLPKGEALLRLQHYLDAGHLTLDELTEVPKPAYKLGQLIAFNILSMDEAQSHLEYTNMNELFRLLRGSSLRSDRGKLLNQLIAENKDRLEDEVLMFQMRHRQQPKSEPTPARPDESVRPSTLSSEILLSTVLGSVELLHTSLDIVDLQSYDASTALQLTPSDRNRVERLIDRLRAII